MSVFSYRSFMLSMTAILVAGGCQQVNGDGEEGRVVDSDMLIQNALIVDGTGGPSYTADVLVDAGVIQRIGSINPENIRAGKLIDAGGRVLAPGFIDSHAHGDPISQSYEGFLAMGVTTIVLGQDGRTAGVKWDSDVQTHENDLASWMIDAEREGVQVNVASMSGHGTIRYQVGVGEKSDPLTDQEIALMQERLRKDMEAGAFGMTSGLEYVPGLYSTEKEMVSLAKVVGEYDGVIMSHMRTEDDDKIEEGIGELVAQGEHARIHISHLKIVYGKGEERAKRLLTFIDGLQGNGVEISSDIYPYAAGYTGVAILFPEWALPPNDYKNVIAERRDELEAYLTARVIRRNGPQALLFGSEPYVGLTLEEAASKAGKSFSEFLIDIGPDGGSGAHFTQDRSTHDTLVVSLSTAISTDGGPGIRHPRGTGTYAKLIDYYVQESEVLSLEEAVYKATGLPASIMKLEDRGVIKEGAKADIILFNPENVKQMSDYTNPFSLAEGFDLVLVNGKVAWENGQLHSGRHGSILRR